MRRPSGTPIVVSLALLHGVLAGFFLLTPMSRLGGLGFLVPLQISHSAGLPRLVLWGLIASVVAVVLAVAAYEGSLWWANAGCFVACAKDGLLASSFLASALEDHRASFLGAILFGWLAGFHIVTIGVLTRRAYGSDRAKG